MRGRAARLRLSGGESFSVPLDKLCSTILREEWVTFNGTLWFCLEVPSCDQIVERVRSFAHVNRVGIDGPLQNERVLYSHRLLSLAHQSGGIRK
jgi:hypothetical protein